MDTNKTLEKLLSEFAQKLNATFSESSIEITLKDINFITQERNKSPESVPRHSIRERITRCHMNAQHQIVCNSE